MSHDTPQPGQKQGWFQDVDGSFFRHWDEDDDRLFMGYCEDLASLGLEHVIERFRWQKFFVDPDTLLNRMASRIAKVQVPNG